MKSVVFDEEQQFVAREQAAGNQDELHTLRVVGADHSLQLQ